MRWLDGHPLSMRLVLPHLDNTEPQALLAALHGTRALPGEDDGGRTTSLPASVAYSFAHLDPVAQQALTAVSLFHGVVDADVLSVFSGAAGVPDRFAGHSAQDWAAMLDRAAGVGLLSRLGAGMYRIHPALPAYLAAHWRRHDPDAYPSERAAGERALLDAYAHFSQWLGQQILAGDAALAFTVIAAQQRTLGALLGYALDNRLWEQAQAIGQPLDEYWHVRGLHEEARGWVDRARLVLEAPDGAPPSFDTPAGALWLFLAGAQAGRDIEAGRHGQAEQTYQDIQQALQRQSDSPQQRARLAVVYHQLGMVVQDRRRLDDAEDWYRKSLAIQEELGNRPGMAASYHQLGVVAQVRGRLGDAEDWYRKSLAIQEELGNRPDMAGVHHQLGMVAQFRGRLDEAEDWYRKSLTINGELGNRPGMASSYHQLGMVAQDRGRLDEAEDWYRKSLTINEEFGNRPGMASSYHQLGVIDQDRGLLDEAEDWYRKSLAIQEELGNRPGMTISFGQLGLLAEARHQRSEALTWMVRCVALFDEFPHPATRPGPEHLARLTAELGMDALERAWQQVTDHPLPQAVRDYLRNKETS
jgi:tetratricopeptide (TPR) repeat protein